jgi:hypothetical protein
MWPIRLAVNRHHRTCLPGNKTCMITRNFPIIFLNLAFHYFLPERRVHSTCLSDGQYLIRQATS